MKKPIMKSPFQFVRKYARVGVVPFGLHTPFFYTAFVTGICRHEADVYC